MEPRSTRCSASARPPGVRILFVASECAPFAKAGGLGDVVGALPKALHALGHDVRVLMPKYGHVDASGFSHLGSMGVPLGFGAAWSEVHEGRLPDSEVPIYLLEHDTAFGAPVIYGDEPGTVWGAVKFGILSRGAFELCRFLDWKPEIFHLHDWPSAWAAVYLNGPEAHGFGSSASVLTIHNMAHQPRFPAETLTHLAIPEHEMRADSLEDFGEVNPFKGGLYHCTMITTVSPRYAHEIRSPTGGAGLDRIADLRGGDLVGILNGIDEEIWDPAVDATLPANYGPEDMVGKAACKVELERVMGLDPEPHGPLLGVVSRLSPQKGLDVLADGLVRILATGARLCLLGSGDPALQDRFRWLAQQYPGRVGVRIGYDERLAHLIEAGSDMFMMPSRFEPCGLNQLYSQRYGTLPIVHATGGLDDTVEQCDPIARTGTGFKMYALHTDALVNTTRWAIQVYRRDPELFAIMQQNGMKKRMGWDEAAHRYADVYRWSLERKGVFPS